MPSNSLEDFVLEFNKYTLFHDESLFPDRFNKSLVGIQRLDIQYAMLSHILWDGYKPNYGNSDKDSDFYMGTCNAKTTKDLHTLHANAHLPSTRYMQKTLNDQQRENYFIGLRAIDWEEGHYSDGGSCFWKSRSSAVDLINERGFAVVFHHTDRWFSRDNSDPTSVKIGNPAGRALILHNEDDGLYVFNSYGVGLKWAATVLYYYLIRIGFCIGTPHVTRFVNNGESTGTLYINSEIAIRLPFEQPNKEYFQDWIRNKHCTVDLKLKTKQRYLCTLCSEVFYSSDPILDGYLSTYCDTCGEELEPCPVLLELFNPGDMFVAPDGIRYSKKAAPEVVVELWNKKLGMLNESRKFLGFWFPKTYTDEDCLKELDFLALPSYIKKMTGSYSHKKPKRRMSISTRRRPEMEEE